MLGALIGDIVGSIYEWDNHRSKDFPLFGPGCDYTDDSVCTVALADALLTGAYPARHLQAWCRRHPGRGYGGMFADWIDQPDPRRGHACFRLRPVTHRGRDPAGDPGAGEDLPAGGHDRGAGAV